MENINKTTDVLKFESTHSTHPIVDSILEQSKFDIEAHSDGHSDHNDHTDSPE